MDIWLGLQLPHLFIPSKTATLVPEFGWKTCLKMLKIFARRAGSDCSMSASGSAVQGSIPGGVVYFNLKIFNLGATRGGDVHFLIARLYIIDLDKLQTLQQYVC